MFTFSLLLSLSEVSVFSQDSLLMLDCKWPHNLPTYWRPVNYTTAPLHHHHHHHHDHHHHHHFFAKLTNSMNLLIVFHNPKLNVDTKWVFDFKIQFAICDLVIRPSVLSCSATCDTTCIYQVIANNQALFHLWWKENLLNYQNVLWTWHYRYWMWHYKHHWVNFMSDSILLFGFDNSYLEWPLITLSRSSKSFTVFGL